MADELRQSPTTITDRVAQALSGLGVDAREAYRFANKAKLPLELNPITGAYTAGQEAIAQAEGGHPVLSALAGGGMLPFIGGISKGPKGLDELRKAAKILGEDPTNLAGLRKAQELEKFRAGLGQAVKSRAEAMAKEIAARDWKFPIGARIETAFTKSRGEAPYEIIGYSVNKHGRGLYRFRRPGGEEGSLYQDAFDTQGTLLGGPKDWKDSIATE